MRLIFSSALFLFLLSPAWTENSETPTEPKATDDSLPTKIVHEEHTVYIPYDEIERVFEKEGRGVFLPYAEFIKLWQKARPIKPPKPKPKPPFEAAISAGSYEGSVNGTAATITATYNVEMLKEEGWAALPLPLSGVAVTESAIEGGKAILNVTDQGYVMLMEKPGMYKLTMKFVVRVDRKPGQNSFTFNCPRAAVSRLQMTLPGSDLAVKVDPLLVASTNAGQDGKTVVQAFLGSTNRLSFEWRPKTVQKGKEDSLRFAKTSIRASAQEGALRAEAEIAYEILRTPADSFRVSLPKEVNVITVDGANIKDWNTADEEQRKIISISLHTPEKKAYLLKVVVEQPVDQFPAELAFPEIIPLDASRETGTLVVTGSEYLDVKVKSRTGLSQIALEDLPANMRPKDAFFAGTYVSHPFNLVLTATRIVPKVTASVASVVTILKENLQLKSAIQYRIRKAGIFKVSFKIPASLDIREVGSDQTVDDYSVVEENEQKTVTVNLASRAFGEFTLPVLCEELREAETGQLSLPVLEVVDVSRQTGAIAVAVHETLEAKVEDSENATPLGIQELQNARLRADTKSGARTVFGFHYVKQPVSVDLSVEKRKPHVTARVDTLVQIAEDAVKLRTWLVYAVNYAGITDLSFSVPGGLGDDLRISGANIKEKVRTTEEAEEGAPKRDRWRVSLQSETIGEYQLLLEYETKLEGIRKESGADFAVPEIIVHDVARENGFVAVTKGPNVEVVEDIKGLDPIDSRELPDSRLATPGTFLSFKYLYHPYTLKLKATLHDYVSVLQSLVNEAYLESVISKDGVIMTEARYLVQTNQLQLLPLTLPENSEVRSLFVNGQAERPRKGESGELLVPVAKVTPGQSFMVSIVYESQEDGGEMGWLGQLNTSAPGSLSSETSRRPPQPRPRPFVLRSTSR